MNTLIQINVHNINQELIQTVNARELHSLLKSKQQFADWIKKRISKYNFIENQDFICLSEIYETQRTDGQKGVKTTKEYYITLDMAKQLAMVENNQQGLEARKYFIECEKQLLQVNTVSLSQKLRALADAVDKLEQTKHYIENKKVATALGTAGAKSKQLEHLKNSFGMGKDKASINGVYIATGLKYKWQPLKQWCIDNDVEPEQISEYMYGLVKLYPAQAWLDVYALDLTKLFFNN